MKLIFIIGLILLIIVGIVIVFVTIYNQIHETSSKIDKAQKSIEELLKKKHELMYGCYKYIKKHVKKKDYLKEFDNLTIEKYSTYELDEELNKYFEVMKEIKTSYKSLNNKDYQNILKSINEISENIIANERYFNKYNNKLIKELTGINKVVAKLTNIKVRTSYEIKEPIEE